MKLLMIQGTVKKKIVTIFLLFYMLIFVSITIVSFFTVNILTKNNITASMLNNLYHAQLYLEKKLSNLDYVSQQIAYSNEVLEMLKKYKDETTPYYQAEIRKAIGTRINLIAFSNPDIGLVTFFDDLKNTVIYNNFTLDTSTKLETFPPLNNERGIVYYGPHPSLSKTMKDTVISAKRTIALPGLEGIYLYLESEFNLKNQFSNNDDKYFFFAIESQSKQIVYSENNDVFPESEKLDSAISTGKYKNYYWFRGETAQEYGIIIFVEQKEFNIERNQWLTTILLLGAVLLVLGIVMAFAIYRDCYYPIKLSSDILGSLEREGKFPKLPLTGIREFDLLVNHFSTMKKQIDALIDAVQKSEKQIYDFKYKVLFYQINPHFLTNTLNSIHWLALRDKNKEIASMVQNLNKLLIYNLGKNRKQSTLRSEVEAIQQYMDLQKFRYDFEYTIFFPDKIRMQDIPVPKFMLQPLVENCIFHGIEDDGIIQITILEDRGFIIITVEDNGVGMRQEIAERINSPLSDKQPDETLGIGIPYIKHALYMFYASNARLYVESLSEKGTKIVIEIPALYE